jgi:Intracellular proteinase inhibitor
VLHSLLLQDSIAFRAELPPAIIAGKPVPLVLRLTNRTEHPITLTLQGRPLAFDVTVTGSDGALVWRRLEGAAVSSILAVRTLDPAESLVFEAVWDGRDRQGRAAHPGTYLVTGKLLTDTPDGLVTLPAPLTLVAH